MKADMSDIVFAGENFSSPLPYSFWYVPWEAQQVRCNSDINPKWYVWIVPRIAR